MKKLNLEEHRIKILKVILKRNFFSVLLNTSLLKFFNINQYKLKLSYKYLYIYFTIKIIFYNFYIQL